MASDDWVHYKCKTGNTFFVHNKQTGEYRWLTDVNGPDLMPVKYSTIATQTDDYECCNGCSSIYINTSPHTHSSRSADLSTKPQSEIPIHLYSEDKLDEGHSLVYESEGSADLETNHYREDYTEITNCFDEIPSMVKVFERSKNSQSGNNFITTETVTCSTENYECNDDIGGRENSSEKYYGNAGYLSEENCMSSTKNCDKNNDNIEVIVSADSIPESDNECLSHGGIEGDDLIPIPKVLKQEANSTDSANENQPSDDKGRSSTVTVYVNSQTQPQENSQGQRKRKHQCPICQRLFIQPINLNRHLHAHANENKFYDCSYCSKRFKHKRYLMFHMRTHTNDKPFACHLCDKKFTLKGTLKGHLERHTGARPFKCEHCERTYTRKSHLNEHMKKHNGTAKELPCSYCGKMFSLQGDLNMHLRIHTGWKPHACTFCEMKFTHRGNLNRHLQTHTGEKPFECSYCKKSFARSTYLKLHMKKHLEENNSTSQEEKEI